MGEIELLKEALDTFVKATDELNRAYEELKLEVRRLNEELEAHKKLLSSILESISDGVIAVDENRKIIRANRAAKEMFGADIEGKSINDIIEDKEELDFKRNGRRFVILVRRAPLVENEKIIGEVIVLTDITRQRELEEENKRKERLSAMGEMAVALAHEIRNPLASIELFAGLLKRGGERSEEISWAESIISVVKSINNLISNMLLFTKPMQVEKQRFKAKELVDDMLTVARHIIKEKNTNIKIINDDIELFADKELLKQVVLNLFINAVQSIDKDRGIITLEFCEDSDKTYIKIKDNGCGISKEDLARIFDPFFTTKKRGTGLGLAIVHRIVEAHNGNIKVESEPGVGTTFTVSIPKA